MQGYFQKISKKQLIYNLKNTTSSEFQPISTKYGVAWLHSKQ